MSVQDESGGVQLTLDEIPPQWAAEYDDPVIVSRSLGGCHHEPDLDADEPAPVCYYANKDVEWHVKERAFEDGWSDHCEVCEKEVGDAR